jgi:hypothetical protein
VDDVSLTVTFSPADVNSPKPDVETLLTVPIDPPAAGPDRAFDPLLADTGCPDAAAVDVVDVVLVVLELDEPPQAESPITGTSSPAVAAIDAVSRCLKSLFWTVMSNFFPFHSQSMIDRVDAGRSPAPPARSRRCAVAPLQQRGSQRHAGAYIPTSQRTPSQFSRRQ